MQEYRTSIHSLGDFTFDSGETLPNIQLACECYGSLNADKSNVLLLFHALTGSHHAHGMNSDLPEAGEFWQPENHEGWWNLMIGAGRPLDTDKYFIICVNYLGSCYGSSGPTSLAPDGEPWGSRFPLVTARDQARAQMQLLTDKGIERVHLVAPSVGGLVSLPFACLYPERIKGLLIIGASYKPSTEHRLSVFEQIIAIEMDEKYQSGRYPLADPPRRGLALARIICHKLFVDQRGLPKRARATTSIDRKGMLSWYAPARNTESYMLHQGTKFAKRFDANAYIRIVNMWADFDLCLQTDTRRVEEAFAILAKHAIPLMIFSISTDDCFLPRDISAFHRRLVRNGVQAKYRCIQSQKGHDSFLLEPELYAEDIAAFLAL